MALTSEGTLLTDKHRREQVRLAITADSQARRIWDNTLDLNDLKGSQPIWKNAILDLMQIWWKISADTASQYLPRFREAETGEPTDIEVGVPRFDRAQAAQRIDWIGATNVLWHIARGETQEAAYAAARSLFLGVFHEAVLTGGRTTIEHWAQKDQRATGWRRVSDGDPCAFCAMLVTRGPVYTSEQKALFRASDAKKYHPHCGCTVEVVYGDWQPTKREQQWIDDYYRAAESLPSRTPRTAETVLPILRRNGEFRDSLTRRSTPEALAARRKAYAEKKAREHAERVSKLEALLAQPVQPMSISKADQSHTNPDFASGRRGTHINCQSCVPAYEMRRRGHDVIALPFGSDQSRQVFKDTTLVWINPNTGRPPTRFNVGWKNPERVTTKISMRINPGERYAMSFAWQRGNKGHIVVLERPYTQHGNVVIVVDPQSGVRMSLDQYLQGKPIRYESVGIYRIDNLELNTNIAAGLMEGADHAVA